MSTALPIVYCDEAMIVLDKPSGLLSVPGRGPDNHDSLSVRVQAQFPDALIVHRLDMGTSGLLLMARGIEAQRTLSLHFAERRTHKRYVAIVQGELPLLPDWSTIDAPLIVDWPNRPRSPRAGPGAGPRPHAPAARAPVVHRTPDCGRHPVW